MKKTRKIIQFYLGLALMILAIVFSLLGTGTYVSRIVILILGILIIITSRYRLMPQSEKVEK